jgi:hypothetical protein
MRHPLPSVFDVAYAKTRCLRGRFCMCHSITIGARIRIRRRARLTTSPARQELQCQKEKRDLLAWERGHPCPQACVSTLRPRVRAYLETFALCRALRRARMPALPGERVFNRKPLYDRFAGAHGLVRSRVVSPQPGVVQYACDRRAAAQPGRLLPSRHLLCRSGLRL